MRSPTRRACDTTTRPRSPPCSPARPIVRRSCARGAPPSSRRRQKGEQCRLEPNRIFNPGHRLQRRVPKRPVCGYFLLGNSRETRLVVSRLQTAHVIVDRLARRTVVPDFRPYGDAPRRTTLPAGTYWISLAQAQKHWVQAALNEDTYVPFPYFYDVSGWSLPLLAGIRGRLHRAAGDGSRGPRPDAAHAHHTETDGPAAADRGAGPVQAHLQRLPVHRMAQVAAGPGLAIPLPGPPARSRSPPRSLRKVDVLVVGNVDSKPVYRHLGAKGRAAVAAWVARGGRYVGWQEGALLASALGISQVGMITPKTESPGAMMRIRTPHGPNEIEWDSDYNLVLAPGAARVVGSFPQPHVRLRFRHEAQDPRRHGPRDGREASAVEA